MKRNFPSASAAPNLMAAPPAPPDTPPDSPPDSSPGINGGDSMSTGIGGFASAGPMSATSGTGTPGTGASATSAEDVNARIEMAMELSKSMVNATTAAPAGAIAAKPSSSTVAPASTGQAPYAGEWTGQFLGPDAGTVSIHVAESGVVQGQGVSTITGIGFSLGGKVSNNGKIDLVQTAAGATATGATFTGSLTRTGKASGTWAMAAYNVSGTWELAVSPGQ